MSQQELIPHLFRTEYRKIVSVLCASFGLAHIEQAEDIASDTFLSAYETWSVKGLPQNPVAWLYTVAKNKTKDYLKRDAVFANTVSKSIVAANQVSEEPEIDLSIKNINDSQLAMIFVVCDPCNPPEAQIALALNLLCGFDAEEIANAFLTNKDTIYKRLQRAKQKLQLANIPIVAPSKAAIGERLPSVLTTLYLLFNEGYFSSAADVTLRKDLCLEAMRLTHLLIENEATDEPMTNALLALMCFHSSRFEARSNGDGATIIYQNQDAALWNQELIARGSIFLDKASKGDIISKYHLEAGIAYWHTIQADTIQKWEAILQLYTALLIIAYSPVAALNRLYALAKVSGKETAIREAEKLRMDGNLSYHSLLGELYNGLDHAKAIMHFSKALDIANSAADKSFLKNKMKECSAYMNLH